MEKYGFVYIWFDRKRKMYYVGCHWGTETDGYICSSNRMRKAYNRRPGDFKRRIISIVTSRENIFEEEYRWLSMIPDEQLGKQYYNIRKHKWGQWSTEKAKTLSETISIKTKEAMQRLEVRENYLKGLATRNTRSSEIEVREKRRVSMIGKNVGKDNSKAISISAEMRRGVPLTEEHRNKIKETTVFKELNSKKIKCIHCDFHGNAGNIGRYHNEKCKKVTSYEII
jgi:hypothetical protein